MNFCPKTSPFKYFSLPNKYGNSLPNVIWRRASYLFGFTQEIELIGLFSRKITNWEKRNKDFYNNYIKNKENILINTPFGCFLLKTILEKKYIKIDKNKVTILNPRYERIDSNSLKIEFARELLLTLSISLIKTIQELMYLSPYPINITLQFALLIGIAKGLVKAFSDALAKKSNSLMSCPWKCLVEVFSEVAGEMTVYSLNLPKNLVLISALKGLWKYLFEQIAGGTYFLITVSELILEVAKVSFKTVSRDYVSSLLVHLIPLGFYFGSFLGSIIGVGLLNIFIDQCTI